MATSKIARRYAKSLMLLAMERDMTVQINEEMKRILETATQSRDFDVFLKSPVIRKDKKIEVINKVFGNSFSKEVSSFIRIITKNDREYLLLDIAGSYVDLFMKQNNVIYAEVVTASAIDGTLREEVCKVLKNLSKSDVELKESIQPEILGGIILRVGDLQYNASVLGKLNKLKQHFNTREYQVKL